MKTICRGRTRGVWRSVTLFALLFVAQPIPGHAVPFFVSFWYPTNGQTFVAPVNVGVHAMVTDSNVIRTMQYYSGAKLIGTVTNTGGVLLTNSTQGNPFFMSWSNVPAGSYTLTAVANDSAGNTSTSAPVNITVSNAPPPVIRPAAYIYSPTNGSRYLAPASLTIYARAVESGGQVATVQFLANSTSLGVVSNSSQTVFTNVSSEPLFPLTWTNVAPGGYALKVVATDTNGNTATSSVVSITVVTNSAPPPPVPFAVSFFYPTNGEAFAAPATIGMHAMVTDSNVVKTVQYFSGAICIGTVTNTSGLQFTNATQSNPFFLSWSNVPAGSYTLTAVAADSAGNTATSGPVNIAVTNVPGPIVPFAVSFWYPANGQEFAAPASVYLHARVSDSNLVQLVEYFAGANLIGVLSNKTSVLLTNSTQANPFYVIWTNVPAGSYTLTALAIDSAGNSATSAPINITVTNVPPPIIPFAVSFWYPTNGQLFAAPANVGVHARVTDSNVVAFVQYFSNGESIGVVSNVSGVLLTNSALGNPFFLAWSNVPVGDYALTAVATDVSGNTATSGPVIIHVLTNLPPTVSIYAPDPVAVEGTNYPNSYLPPTAVTNYVSGTNTATFLIRRDSDTNVDLAVYYSIGGTASNGVDYLAIPNNVVIPAGQRYALITIVPLDDNDSSSRRYDTVVLSLTVPTNAPLAYVIGSPPQAGAIILEENYLPITQPMIRSLADNSLHLSLPATNGLNYCLQVSTDLVNWLPVCTNTVLKGSAQYVDPAATAGLYYRILPVGTPANY